MNIASISAWLKSKSITSHTVAAALVLFATAYTTDQQLRDFIIKLFQNHPTIPADILMACGIILKYTRSSSPAGTVALSQVIEASPQAPTPAAIAAASPTKVG